MKKRWTSIVMAVCLCLGLITTMPAETVLAMGEMESTFQAYLDYDHPTVGYEAVSIRVSDSGKRKHKDTGTIRNGSLVTVYPNKTTINEEYGEIMVWISGEGGAGYTLALDMFERVTPYIENGFMEKKYQTTLTNKATIYSTPIKRGRVTEVEKGETVTVDLEKSVILTRADESFDKENGSAFAWIETANGSSGYINMNSLRKTTDNNSNLMPKGDNIGEMIYDVQDPAENMELPVDMLEQVTDTASAVKATEETVQGMSEEQKQSSTGIDLATLSAETATARAAAKPVSSNEIIIDKTSVSDLQAVAAEASAAVENALISGGVTPERVLSKTVTLTSDSLDELSIRIEPDILTSGVDKVRVETPSCALTFKISDLEADLTKPLVVTLQELGSDTENAPADTTMAMVADVRNFAEGYETVDMGFSDISPLANPVKKVKVNFPDGKMTNAVTVSLPSGGGDKTYQAVVKDNGKATASKYNPATTAIDGKINTSGTYTVQTNQKNFSDIANKSAEMQKAIRYLASKGIINGTTETTFSPDQTISRAQIASLMVQALGKMDNSATANFKDVPKNAWYYHQAASSQKHGLFSGYEDNTFRGGNAIQKDQLVNVTGNVLVKEMRYKVLGNPSAYLSKYSDNVAGWAQSMVALATKENLVVYRTNGTFGGKGTMTRGDAAIIIYRLFMKIW